MFWLLHRRDDVVRRQIELCQPLGVEPDAQRIVEWSKQSDLADAIDPCQRVDDVDGRVIAQINGIVGVLRRVNGYDLQEGSRLLADGQTGARHLLGQLRRGKTGAVLHIDGIDVRIGAQCEGHVEGVAAVGTAGGLIIERVVDAVDLLLDWLRHRGLDHFGIGAWIGRGQRNLRRHDIRELRDRNRRDGNRAGQCDDDGDDEGEPRPVDEDVGKHLSQFPGIVARRHDLTGTHLLYPLDDHQLAFLEAVRHDDVSALLDTGRHASQLDLLRLVDHQDIAAGLIELDSRLRNQQRQIAASLVPP